MGHHRHIAGRGGIANRQGDHNASGCTQRTQGSSNLVKPTCAAKRRSDVCHLVYYGQNNIEVSIVWIHKHLVVLVQETEAHILEVGSKCRLDICIEIVVDDQTAVVDVHRDLTDDVGHICVVVGIGGDVGRNVDVVGGDTTSSTSGLIISVTAIGEAIENELVYRDGARENDLIVVSGDLGAAYVGLQLLEREKDVYLSSNKQVQPDLEGHDYILERQLKPEARTDINELLKKLEVLPTSMIDVSDGLSSEMLHICTASVKGCNLYEEKIPIDPTTYNTAREFNLDPTVCALNGGEDYELLFTIDLKDFDKIKGNPNFTVIGHITEQAQGCNLITKSGALYPLTAQGWNALQESEKEEEKPEE